MKGSHNTMSFLDPSSIWAKVAKAWSKCQDLNLQEQIDKGITYFDIRIRPHGDNNEPHFCHNVIDYGLVDENTSFKLLNDAAAQSSEGLFYARITLDIREKPDNANALAEWFKSYVNGLKERYPNIKFDSIKIFWDWGNDLAEQSINVTEKHWSVVDKKWWEYAIPLRCFAKSHNSDFINDYKNSHSEEELKTNCLMIDYIEFE